MGHLGEKMKIWVFAHCRNEAELLPWFLRHYGQFADQIHIFDDQSDDGSPEIIAAGNPYSFVHKIRMNGLQEDELLRLACEAYPAAIGKADYVMWVDIDEFIYHPKMIECLDYHHALGHDVIRTLGFNMMGYPLPFDDGVSQLTDTYRTGVRAPIYSKPVVFNPSKRLQWSHGKHDFYHKNGLKISPKDDEYAPAQWRLKLLHYRYLTPEYTRARNARQYSRSVHKGAAWSNSPDHIGEHSPKWVSETMHKARDVVRDDACYLPMGIDA